VIIEYHFSLLLSCILSLSLSLIDQLIMNHESSSSFLCVPILSYQSHFACAHTNVKLSRFSCALPSQTCILYSCLRAQSVPFFVFCFFLFLFSSHAFSRNFYYLFPCHSLCIEHRSLQQHDCGNQFFSHPDFSTM